MLSLNVMLARKRLIKKKLILFAIGRVNFSSILTLISVSQNRSHTHELNQLQIIGENPRCKNR